MQMNDNTVAMRWAMRLAILLGVIVFAPQWSASAQGPQTCPAIVDQALVQIDTNCEALDRNFGCYGHNQVFATFAGELPDGTFSRPGDRIALPVLRSIQTAALDIENQQWGAALLNVQANLPNMLPGQGIVLLLLGDVALENEVAPEEVFQLGAGTPVITRAAANLRSGPGLNTNLVATIDAGLTLLTYSIDQTGNWLRVVYDDTPAWVGVGALEPNEQIEALPILMPDRRTAMQSFHLRTGIGSIGCDEAPSVLAIRSPEQFTVSLSINGADIQVGSLVTMQSLAADQMRLTVHHGMVETQNGTLAQDDETLIAIVDPDGNITDWSPPRPATPQEQAIGEQVEAILDNLDTPNTNQPPPENWTVGQLLEVVNVNGAWQRQLPDSANNVIVAVLEDRTPVVVSAGPQWDGIQWWWRVRTQDGVSDGWVEQSQLGERAAAPPSTACTPRTDWTFTYTVQPGDTLFRIAQSAGVSLTELQTANCIADAGAISVGQVLRVPQPVQAPPPGSSPGTSDDQSQQPPPAATEEVGSDGSPNDPQQPPTIVTVPSFEIILPTPTPRVIIR